ncbi:MAG: hypothetical protein KDC87_16835, partial [Planctomycetes bacterium]|nr:hypothetical protein [Planctomycetota bacterium]
MNLRLLLDVRRPLGGTLLGFVALLANGLTAQQPSASARRSATPPATDGTGTTRDRWQPIKSLLELAGEAERTANTQAPAIRSARQGLHAALQAFAAKPEDEAVRQNLLNRAVASTRTVANAVLGSLKTEGRLYALFDEHLARFERERGQLTATLTNTDLQLAALAKQQAEQEQKATETITRKPDDERALLVLWRHTNDLKRKHKRVRDRAAAARIRQSLLDQRCTAWRATFRKLAAAMEGLR